MKSGKLTVNDVSTLTGKSKKTVYRYIKSGKLDATKVHGSRGIHYLIDVDQVIKSGLRFIEQVPVERKLEEKGEQPSSQSLKQTLLNKGKSDSVAIELIKQENLLLSRKNHDLETELRKAAYIIGILKCKYSTSIKKQKDLERVNEYLRVKLLKSNNEINFYKAKWNELKKKRLFARFYNLFKFK